MKKFVNSEYDYALICEDDVYFTSKKKVHLTKLILDLKQFDSEFNILYLGHRLVYNQNCTFEKVDHNFIRVKTNDTHCYIISKDFANHLFNLYSKNMQ